MEPSRHTQNPDTPGATRDKVLKLAVSPHIARHFFQLVLEQHGAELMLDAYVEALFAPGSMLRTHINGPCFVPGAVFERGEAFARRFMTRLQQEREQGNWFHCAPCVFDAYLLVLRHLADPADITQLLLGARRGNVTKAGKILWWGHAVQPVQQHFKARPPAPGELGPVLAPLLRYVDNGLSAQENLSMVAVETALGLVHQLDSDADARPQALVTGSLLKLLGDKQYCQDLVYPIDDNSCVMDHIPRLMAHVRQYCAQSHASMLGKEAMSDRLDHLQTKIDRNLERLFREHSDRYRPPAKIEPQGKDMEVL